MSKCEDVQDAADGGGDLTTGIAMIILFYMYIVDALGHTGSSEETESVLCIHYKPRP